MIGEKGLCNVVKAESGARGNLQRRMRYGNLVFMLILAGAITFCQRDKANRSYSPAV